MSTRRSLILVSLVVILGLAAGALILLCGRAPGPPGAGHAPQSGAAATSERRAAAPTGSAPSQPARGERSARALRMAAAFDSGQLPAAAAVPRGRFDSQAAELARTFIAGGDDAVAALHTAMLLAGIAVRRADGSISPPPHPQGLVIGNWWRSPSSKGAATASPSAI